MNKATVIIPTYNEKGNIEKTIQQVLENSKNIKNWDVYILVVDDNSPDGTAEIVKKISKKNPKVKLLLKKEKQGLGAAYLKGMDYAFFKMNSDIVFEFDADLSHDPTKIPKFLKKIDEGFDIVIGSRYIKGGSIPSNWGIHRKFLSVFGNFIIRTILLNFKIHDWTSGYRAITKDIYKKIKNQLDKDQFHGYTFQVAFLNSALEKGAKVYEVPFHFKDRIIGKSKIGAEYIINNLRYLTTFQIKKFSKTKIFKFLCVGSITAILQIIIIEILKRFLKYEFAYFIGLEIAVLLNFTLSNIWTFNDRKIKNNYIKKFIHFNLASSGSIIIQQIIAFLSATFIGRQKNGITVFPIILTLPIINYKIDMGLITSIVGILIGMIWNFFAYNNFIWKKK